MDLEEFLSKINKMSDGECAVYATSSDTHENVMNDIELGTQVAGFIFFFGWDYE